MTVNDIQNLIDLLNEAPEVAELSVTSPDGSEICLKRGQSGGKPPPPHATHAERHQAIDANIDVAPATPEEPEPILSAIAATMVGIYHSAKPPIKFGAVVRAGQRVGSIESMKLMNDVVSTASGTIVNVLIDDGLPVEYGQVLFEVAAEPFV